eukprot:TRINITY_DN62521_c0_g1_i1.p1 TRINITY_DN62521_c0_g1~~TRINITY_DN62521_c0_g1_i1.p1  ORF type:complete len:556 (+),score=155.53 TRINITY_DN62521_c0_g1_i1:76-1743(+)
MARPSTSVLSHFFAAVLLLLFAPSAQGQSTLKLSATLTIEKTDDKVKTNEHVIQLLNYAKEKKYEGNVQRFLENMVVQLQKVMDAAKVVEEKKSTEVPKDFTPQKYRVKAMPKLNAKKVTVKKMTASELSKRLEEGKDINFKEPMLITNATGLFGEGAWENVRRYWTASRIMEDADLEKELRLEYWPQDKARMKQVGNYFQMEDPEMIPFSRYVINCFHGTPAKPKLPGQNTEHCEQTVDAQSMAHNSSELEDLRIFKQIENALPTMAEFRRALVEAADHELKSILGKGVERWKRNQGRMPYQYFVFGPSGSGANLRPENGLPFFDVLLHGNKRWLLLQEDEMNRVAEKAREALEFDKTSAYMFFEEKLPELREEFGLKKYVEANQGPGDLIIVPSGWFRVSLALADSISYYETILKGKETLKALTDNRVWQPNFRQFRLAYCYTPDTISELPGVTGNQGLNNWLSQAIKQVKAEEAIGGILEVMLHCGATLALDKKMPHLNVKDLSICTPQVWTKCRSQLKAKLKEKKSTATLEWLPKEAHSFDPSSVKKKTEL